MFLYRNLPPASNQTNTHCLLSEGKKKKQNSKSWTFECKTSLGKSITDECNVDTSYQFSKFVWFVTDGIPIRLISVIIIKQTRQKNEHYSFS